MEEELTPSEDIRLCRLCLMAAIIFAFGKEAVMLI